METIELLNEIEKLSFSEKLTIVEKTIHRLKEYGPDDMSIAAESLSNEYKINKELTIFSSLDSENFYEPR